MPRNEFFAVLYILGCANGLLGRTIYALNLEGWRDAVLGFELNVIVYFASFAGVYLIAASSRSQTMGPAVFSILFQTPSSTRRNHGDMDAGDRADRKYGSFCR